MNKLQMTTTGGIATLVASVTKFCELFGDYKIIKIKEEYVCLKNKKADLCLGAKC